MKTLRELAVIITRNKIKAIEILDAQKRETSKLNDFYYLLTEGKFASDEEAAKYFYPDQEGTGSYRKLKAGMKTRMINSLFFLDVKKSNYTDRQSAYYECYKDWAAINILLGKNAYASFKELAKKVLRYAEKYEFTELTRDVSRVLRLHYGAQVGDVKKYHHYRKQYVKYDQICRWEDTAEGYYSDITIEYVNNKSKKEHLSQLVEDVLSELDVYRKETDSYRLNIYYFLIRLIQQNISNDFEAVYVAGQGMADFFERKKYTAATPLQIAYYYQLMACTQLGRYEQGKIIALKCLALQAEGGFNWFKYKELYFLLAMHSGEYREAYLIYKTVADNPRMKFLPENVKEIWMIFWAYLYYLFSIDKLQLPEEEEVFSKFRLGRFVNQTPIFSKDKRGMNVAILIIQILFLTQQKKYNVAIDKFESLEKYCARYLHQAETLRSYYFMKVLLCFPKESFHRVAVERKAKTYLDKLSKIPLENASQTYKVEILPYERLWTFAIDMLNLKGYRPRKTEL